VRDIRFILAASEVDRAFIEAEVAHLGLEEEGSHCQPER